MKGHLSFWNFLRNFRRKNLLENFMRNCVGRWSGIALTAGPWGSRSPSRRPNPCRTGVKPAGNTSRFDRGGVREIEAAVAEVAAATYLITTARKGISSVQLAKELGITQKNAWYLGHRIREAYLDSGGSDGTWGV